MLHTLDTNDFLFYIFFLFLKLIHTNKLVLAVYDGLLMKKIGGRDKKKKKKKKQLTLKLVRNG